MNNILIITTDITDSKAAFKQFFSESHHLFYSQNQNDALETILSHHIDLIFLNLSSEENSISFLKKLKDSNDNIPIIIISSNNTVKVAIEMIKHGAFHYLTKPINEEELLIFTEKALELQKINHQLKTFQLKQNSEITKSIIGKSSEIIEVLSLISKVSKSPATIFISGESGTGKELVAKAIHNQSNRKNKPFVAINCAAIPENLIEAELFGYRRGSFTGAETSKIGKFELAHTGTIFLDEVSSLPLILQSKLLRILQEKELERIGDVHTRKIDIRIISASNIDLKKACEQGKFREDLYYRLNVVPIHLPPLRKRKEDIPLLIDYFVSIYNKEFNKSITSISDDTINYLMQYDWPGNIRELENIVERLIVLSDSHSIESQDLPFELFLPPKIQSAYATNLLKDATNTFEKQFILSALKKSGGNQTKTAEFLGIHRNTLLLKLSQFKEVL
ncbi:sigma 54-interacting transcriptional regulator [Candidatus Margulisiibacteriota bacterium]